METETRYIIKAAQEDGDMFYASGNYCMVDDMQMATRYKTIESAESDRQYVNENIEGDVSIEPVSMNMNSYRIELMQKPELETVKIRLGGGIGRRSTVS